MIVNSTPTMSLPQFVELKSDSKSNANSPPGLKKLPGKSSSCKMLNAEYRIVAMPSQAKSSKYFCLGCFTIVSESRAESDGRLVPFSSISRCTKELRIMISKMMNNEP